MKISCLVAIGILLISTFFIFKFLVQVFTFARNPKKYSIRLDSKKFDIR